MYHPRPLYVYFRLFKQTLQFLQQINVKKCPSSIQFWDSNSRPWIHESPPITTRPGLPPRDKITFFGDKITYNRNQNSGQLSLPTDREIGNTQRALRSEEWKDWVWYSYRNVVIQKSKTHSFILYTEHRNLSNLLTGNNSCMTVFRFSNKFFTRICFAACVRLGGWWWVRSGSMCAHGCVCERESYGSISLLRLP